MAHGDNIPTVLGQLALVLVAARLLGALARALGQPDVLGELLAGVLLGSSVAGVIDPDDPAIALLAQIGVVLLLLETGLETDLRKLLGVGGPALLVALAGVFVPFVLGYGISRALQLSHVKALVAGATMTATSVGITARVLSDLRRLHDPESRIILAAAVADDVIGLVILAVVAGLVEGEPVTAGTVVRIAVVAVGFLAITLLLGQWLVPLLFRTALWLTRGPFEPLLGTLLAFALAWLASQLGSAVIIGAFAAGLLLTRTPHHGAVRAGIVHVGHLFVPLFFVAVGAAVDVHIFNPFDPAQRHALLLGLLFLIAAVLGKLAAGYVPWRLPGRRLLIGVGMIPRGEVGLIFAQMGLSSKVFSRSEFSSLVLMVLGTTFLAPPLLHLLFTRQPASTAKEKLPAEDAEERDVSATHQRGQKAGPR
jgi:Kef-type K+ transport system membrane component KefB